MALHPDALVDVLVEQLSFEGTAGVSWDKLCDILKQQRVDAIEKEPYQNMVYSWLKNNSNIVFIEGENGKPLNDLPASLDADARQKLWVKVSEEHQWIALTGSPKQNNTVGARAFELLVAIAHTRSEGIDSVELIKTTGQDNRSLTQRIKNISHLVKKISILRNGRTLSLFILNRFFDPSAADSLSYSNKSDTITLNASELRMRVINTLKAAKNGIRQVADLRRELEMDKSIKMRTMFKSVISYLQMKGCLSKVLVVSPVSPKRKFRTVKYLKDFVPNENDDQLDGQQDDLEDDADDGEDNDDDDEDMADSQLKDIDDSEPSASLRNVVNLQMVPTDQNDTTTPILNRFFPTQNQLFELVHSNGPTGCSSTFLTEEVFGPLYTRLFSRWVEQFTAGKFPQHIANYAIVRHYDFQGRVKFYRYISRPNLLKLSSQPEDPNGSSLPELGDDNGEVDTSISELNKKHHTPFISRVTIVEDQGVKKIVWFGSINDLSPEMKTLLKESTPLSRTFTEVDPTIPRAKRGRPRKGEERPSNDLKKLKVVKKKPTVKSVKQEIDPIKPADMVESEKLVIADLKGHSFKSIERLSALLRIIEDSDGVKEWNHKLYTDLCEELGYMTDRKTFKKDVASLIDQKKVYTEKITVSLPRNQDESDDESDHDNDNDVNDDDEPANDPTQRRTRVVTLLISNQATKETIDTIREHVLSTPRIKAHPFIAPDELTGIEMDFFDTELRVAFTNPQQVIQRKEVKVVKPKILPPDISAAVKEVKAKKLKATGSIKAKVRADPNATHEEIFAQVPKRAAPKKKSDKTKEKKSTKATANKPRTKKGKTDLEMKISKQIKTKRHVETSDPTHAGAQRLTRANRKRRVSQLNSEELMNLFKTVIICKTLNENVMDWEKISKIFPHSTPDALKTKWARVRTMMGVNGISVARRTWKKILLKAVNEDKVQLEDIENVQLDVLLKLWQDNQWGSTDGDDDLGEKLFADVEQNYKEYGFVKSDQKRGQNVGAPYDYNSMVQREQYLVNSVFTYDQEETGDKLVTETTKEDTIRRLIIAILSSGENLDITKLTVLEPFEEDDINKVFLDMSKKREIVISSNDGKVSLGDCLTGLLEDHTYDFSIEKIGKFQELLKDLCSNNKGLVLDPVFDNSFMVPILELIKDQALNITRVDHYRKEILNGYEARILEREKLDCDIILDKPDIQASEIKGQLEKIVLVPGGEACSRIWIDVQGKINKEMWRRVVRVVISSIISRPGVTIGCIGKDLATLLSGGELEEVIEWMVKSGAVKRGDEDGLWPCSQWYVMLGLY